MVSVKEVLEQLKAKAKPDRLIGMARYGMATERRLGVSIPDMRKIAKEIGKDHTLAIELWKTKISEAMILASMIDESAKLTTKQMDEWVKDKLVGCL
jgi:3-methyladenine DNA glycosylase AlkD